MTQAGAPICRRLSSVEVKSIEMLAPEVQATTIGFSVPRVLVGVNGATREDQPRFAYAAVTTLTTSLDSAGKVIRRGFEAA